METIILSQRHAAFLSRVSGEINPAMPPAFGWPHAIRLILERIEESGVDLTQAASEGEIASLAAVGLRARSRRRTADR
jgi:hypothetical protein